MLVITYTTGGMTLVDVIEGGKAHFFSRELFDSGSLMGFDLCQDRVELAFLFSELSRSLF